VGRLPLGPADVLLPLAPQADLRDHADLVLRDVERLPQALGADAKGGVEGAGEAPSGGVEHIAPATDDMLRACLDEHLPGEVAATSVQEHQPEPLGAARGRQHAPQLLQRDGVGPSMLVLEQEVLAAVAAVQGEVQQDGVVLERGRQQPRKV
jgi:hypothetical protein